MDKVKLVAILRGIQPGEAAEHIAALIEAGFRYIEIPLNSPDWQQSIPAMVRQFGERAVIGAGTVLKVEQVDFLTEAGAKLIVTPNTAPAVIRRAVDKGMLVCAGCATASEAFSALDAGAQWLKIFPSSAFGPDYIRALKAVLPPEVSVLAVGGVTPENLHSWRQAGCAGAGLGSDLYRAGQSLARTRQQAQRFIAACGD
ncbi:2-dehydro-3-deoxy-6-phosphogalactonate aldolase [Klebsiella aerogenes]|uniref:2-dehydro-3-deoxy-6-phosphogalactonate aldolase n=1 Tax=Klebsiella aerogenes (strain ATCC 13048 / DSM 30053 / CCUG 1429 / JCM 1235 / KCTC 2190 / NBRC 13534 / NCIMB 10102 / NCTC 10006 / CDC 819-56) TaxID=1028307 RepID=A0A0H3FNJ9_KLEAK|nr:2-dehydro-3-deoxy-6-phosphogalactonate aldolase [Klebsiella aerogenes]AEG97004.1 2-dehydro-3-deoxy-6-phosphogalactonate aldolase [Klebsiella aerogenes KCTC 2190]EMF0927688.1 2-dehydro-3-deoxy-6-phosphogalactonate aldolase [Klebsiella aerogenes]KLF46051.1 2-dehydro-3-deoxy-6-phosphogalactonate aldolase [Klebsiella aerogenes]MEC4760838.1 2-dehydro-3-deoxy-6-phosphogalactonate aldolase [Klebsiella aerogenes]QEU20108.1 2-dehydro-3-deoxy-6-phosphogalactonate aldolase [Klebsiella aerogenes]|eukprot:TRINITY_DN9111_c0_g1_i1.p1 TRINITY_DN9111_c0_g1~~TRINITY_DN9111_c0_g1_i1.p1  ORF type:complete len:200 (-),score=12.00 TRINITY_DN9111_c0_g1_i1:146-745(-)